MMATPGWNWRNSPTAPEEFRQIAALLQQDRRRHAARRQHHDLGVDPEAMRRLAGERPHDPALDPGCATLPPGQHALDARRGEDASAVANRRRHVGDVHRLLGARPTAGEALAAAAAADDVARDRLARPAESAQAVAKEKVSRTLDLIGRGRDAEEAFDRLVVRVEIGARHATELELLAPGVEVKSGERTQIAEFTSEPPPRRSPASSA
jgi:hypothetical protein